ncbi:hypothetical protein F5144DRAFT_202645 [Chaetomium tenue]|uniref:Uncharacterized protein n=1 Tax=Chaetomium tenue TaxID=1854479 RepID=A0ACB7PF95_9PEZI|nr:hypothetical protein F5144DRAFT_202645 [Chaetomium globosum]
MLSNCNPFLFLSLSLFHNSLSSTDRSSSFLPPQTPHFGQLSSSHHSRDHQSAPTRDLRAASSEFCLRNPSPPFSRAASDTSANSACLHFYSLPLSLFSS